MCSWIQCWYSWLRRKVVNWWWKPSVEKVRFGYEKAGITIYDEPVPWNAGGVLVEFLIKDPGGVITCGKEFSLETPPGVFIRSVTGSEDENDRYKLLFWLGPFPGTESLCLRWHGLALGKVMVPYLRAEMFFSRLRLVSPATLAHLGEFEVICRTVVAGQCHHLTACGVLQSPTSLVPVTDWDIAVEITGPNSSQTWRFSAHLTGSQVASHQSLLNVTLPAWLCGEGIWSCAGLSAAGSWRRARSG